MLSSNSSLYLHKQKIPRKGTNMNKLLSGILLLSLLFVTACGESEGEALARNVEEIEQWLADNNLTAERTEDDLFYIIREPGGTNHPNVFNDVEVNYVGTLLDGTQFDANDGIMFNLGGVIRGWQLGIPLIGVGGDILLLCPAKLAYGDMPPSATIPENAVLKFDVELLDFN